ncbi:MAG: hypothetical protein QM758_18975 [Armatimonas sp.]
MVIRSTDAETLWLYLPAMDDPESSSGLLAGEACQWWAKRIGAHSVKSMSAKNSLLWESATYVVAIDRRKVSSAR